MKIQFKANLENIFDRIKIHLQKFPADGDFYVIIDTQGGAGSDNQNRAFHALLTEFYKSGLHSYDSQEDMKYSFKLRAGGAEYFGYQEDGYTHVVEKLEDIPAGVDWIGLPKSWSNFTKSERQTAIDLVISEGYQAGMNSRHWNEIIEGMENE